MFQEAVAAADSFFAIANKERLMPIHYLRYGEALCGARQYTKALMVYEQLLKKPAMEWRDSLACLGHITTVMVEQANEYIREGRHAAAAKRPSNMPRRFWR